MRQRGVKVVDGFDADDAEFQAVLVRVDVGVCGWMDGCGLRRCRALRWLLLEGQRGEK